MAANLARQGILRKPGYLNGRFHMVTQSASADFDGPEYTEFNRLNEMIDKRYSHGSRMSYANGRFTQTDQQVQTMKNSHAVFSNNSSNKLAKESEFKNQIQLPEVVGSPLQT